MGRDVVVASDSHVSPYRELFRQGATLVPRMLVTIEEVDDGPIGVTAGRTRIRSARSANEKPPWKGLSSLDGVVERQFVRPMHVGATILAYRACKPHVAIVPEVAGELLDGSSERLDEFPGLAAYWRMAEQVWDEKKKKRNLLTLRGRVDYHGELTKQFPIAKHRVLYTKSGQHLAACRIEDQEAVIDHKLYWATVSGEEEARYLCAVLNSQVLADAVVGLQARGQHNPRDFDMHVFALGFPIFDSGDGSHRELAQFAARAEKTASEVDVDPAWQFQKARRIIREALREDGVGTLIDAAVADLLSTPTALPSREELVATAPDLMGALSETQKKTKGKSRKKRPRPTPTKRPTRSSSNPRRSAR